MSDVAFDRKMLSQMNKEVVITFEQLEHLKTERKTHLIAAYCADGTPVFIKVVVQ